MIIGARVHKPNDQRWASLHQYRGFRGSSFYGEPLANATWFCAENTSSCGECISCCNSSQFKRGSKGLNACIRRCKRKFPAGTCEAGGTTVPPPPAPGPPPPPGAEMCPMVCVPDGTGVTCNYNCMGVSMNIINTDVPGEVIPLQKATSLFDRSKWNGSWAGWPSSRQANIPWNTAGTIIPADELEGGGIIDMVVNNAPMILLLGGGLFLAVKVLKK